MTNGSPTTGIQKPPRLNPIKTVEDASEALGSLADYTFNLYRQLTQTTEFLRTQEAFATSADFDPGQPLDPNNTSISEVAQAVNANQVNIATNNALAQAAKTLADANKVRLDALAALALLNQTITNPPTQAEVQAISDKVDEIIGAV